jgi:hypothetical protein
LGRGGCGLTHNGEHGKLSRGIKRALDVTKAWAGKRAHNAEWLLGRKAARVLGVVALFAVVVALLLVFLDWYVAPNKPGEKKDLILALAQILGGTALLSGLYFTWRTLQVNREGQITDRFTRAIDQLGKVDDEGNKLFEIRLGGIYALERIARESEEDHWPIMEVLTAYVRQHAPWRPEGGRGEEADSAVEKKSVEDSSSDSDTAEVSTPDPDIQAIMTVLRRRSRFFGHGEPEHLDLRETNLSGADLRGANLMGADLGGASLMGANLGGADLRGTTFRRADLRGALLGEADLGGAWFSGAYFSGAYYSEAYLGGADFSGANLSGARNLIQAQLEGTRGDKDTRLPSNLKPPAHWGVKTDEQGEGD